jgi:hypothetical protein
MRWLAPVLLLGLSASAQTLVEHAAAAAGGTVGGVAGKKASDALTNILNKVDKSTAKAAATDAPAKTERRPEAEHHPEPGPEPSASEEPLFDVGPGVPHSKRSTADRSGVPSVPPPPPLAHHAAPHRAARSAEAPEPLPAPVVALPPPPPLATAQDLKKIAVGTRREDLVKLGFPAIHLMMLDNGHLVETFHYTSESKDVGVVHLTDGAVSSVQVN